MSAQSRTKTDPEVKWVANELAAVTGELHRLDELLERLAKHRQSLLERQAALSTVANLVGVLQRMPEVPVVCPQGRFGARGALRNLIRATLRQAYPQGVTTSILADLVIETFNLPVAAPKERKRLIDNTIRDALKKLHNRGEIEPMHLQTRTGARVGLIAGSGIWRWKAATPTLEELRLSAGQAARASVVTDGD